MQEFHQHNCIWSTWVIFCTSNIPMYISMSTSSWSILSCIYSGWTSVSTLNTCKFVFTISSTFLLLYSCSQVIFLQVDLHLSNQTKYQPFHILIWLPWNKINVILITFFFLFCKKGKISGSSSRWRWEAIFIIAHPFRSSFGLISVLLQIPINLSTFLTISRNYSYA